MKQRILTYFALVIMLINSVLNNDLPTNVFSSIFISSPISATSICPVDQDFLDEGLCTYEMLSGEAMIALRQIANSGSKIRRIRDKSQGFSSCEKYSVSSEIKCFRTSDVIVMPQKVRSITVTYIHNSDGKKRA